MDIVLHNEDISDISNFLIIFRNFFMYSLKTFR